MPLWIAAPAFVLAALAVWRAGFRLVRHADAIACKTGIGREVMGVVLLGGVTSLPELSVAVTATLSGVPLLSVNDVIGSAAFNVLILAGADIAYGRGALTATPATPGVLLQGVLGIVGLALVAAAVSAGDVLLFGMGAWSWLLLVFYAGAISVISKSRASLSWSPAPGRTPALALETESPLLQRSLRSLLFGTGAAGVTILIAGVVLAKAAEVIAEHTGLGHSFVGGVFLAGSTSLPEVSTVLAAVRLRRYEMALADVFGTNLFNVTIIAVVDALHPGGPVLAQAGPFAAFNALLAIVLTALYLVGLLERRDRTVLRMGFDSLAALLCYAAGIVVLYQLR
jgi:cation:H+ antiporter